MYNSIIKSYLNKTLLYILEILVTGKNYCLRDLKLIHLVYFRILYEVFIDSSKKLTVGTQNSCKK